MERHVPKFVTSCYHFFMSDKPNFCVACGASLVEASKFCSGCGTPVTTVKPVLDPESANNFGFWKRYWRKSLKAKIFYGLWVFLNFTNILTFFSAANAPVDRFRSVCGWEGVSCGPSSQDRMGQAVLNLIIWNSLFWGFRFFYKKRQSNKGST